MKNQEKVNIFKAKYRSIWIAILLVFFIGLAFISAADNIYNQLAENLANSTNQVIVLPKVTKRPFMLGLDLQGGTQLVYEADVSAIAEGERSSALEGVRDIIERRVDATGVSEPMIQVNRTLAGDYRIIAELAGIKDVNEAIRIIGETPILEFKEQDDEIIEDEMDKVIKESEEKALEIANLAMQEILAGKSLNEVYENYQETAQLNENYWINELENPTLIQKIIDLEINEIYEEPLLNKENFSIVLLLDKRMAEIDLGIEAQEGLEISSDMEEYLISSLDFPIDYVMPEIDPQAGWKNTELTGQHLRRSVLQFNPRDGRPEVVLEFNNEGRELFAEITKRNIGRPVAIFLDDYPISIPNVHEEIPDGRAVISGQFDLQEARLLVQRLNTGALPVPIELIGQQTVGASLGDKSVNNSLMAALFGFLFVALFMLVFYRFPGLVAIVSLIIYVLAVLTIFKALPILLAFLFILILIILFSLVFSELKIFDGLVSLALFFVITAFLIFYAVNPVTLTLAGITGFILSIGMAVDANILIFERMKEELKSGKSLNNAIDEGFRRAWPSIRDGNITTILVCFALMTFGTGLVKGFGATLFIGVSISMFSSIVVTRILLKTIKSSWLEKRPWLLGSRIRKDLKNIN
jgi:protein-export membrane protein SecD